MIHRLLATGDLGATTMLCSISKRTQAPVRASETRHLQASGCGPQGCLICETIFRVRTDRRAQLVHHRGRRYGRLMRWSPALRVIMQRWRPSCSNSGTKKRGNSRKGPMASLSETLHHPLAKFLKRRPKGSRISSSHQIPKWMQRRAAKCQAWDLSFATSMCPFLLREHCPRECQAASCLTI